MLIESLRDCDAAPIIQASINIATFFVFSTFKT